MTAARQRTEKVILESECFKANIAAPHGRLSDIKHLTEVDEHIIRLRELDNDDDFFHVTCHLDPVIKAKIEVGDFVDLEKLLPKERGGLIDSRNEQLMELVSKGDSTYLTVDDTKMNGIRKWEQAFQIYAAVYSKANPSRSAEIWGYVYVINAATSSHSWECVAFYDYTFRQLMVVKPMRSWSKTYLQGWNLALSHTASASSNSNDRTGSFADRGQQGKHDWRDDCCWRFNKGKCKKREKDCGFDHRCMYCGKWGHGFHNCRK